MRVLIVDDNAADVNLVKEIFDEIEGVRYEPIVIDNGNDCLKYLLRTPPFKDAKAPHLIILDLNLPGLSGLDILRELGKHHINIPVVVYTTSDRPEDIQKAYELNANCYVVKAPEFSELHRVLRLVGQFWLTVVKLPHGER